jgi:hypothetical protein
MSENGAFIDLDYAYARLNDDALAASGGTLASLPERKPVTDKQGDIAQAGTGESVTQDGGIRLQKDLASDERAVVDSSDDEESSEDDSGGSYSDEENRGRTSLRGRKSASLIDLASEPSSRGNSTDRDSNVGVDPGGGKKKKKKKKSKKSKKGDEASTKEGKKKIMSLLGAAEDERTASLRIIPGLRLC